MFSLTIEHSMKSLLIAISSSVVGEKIITSIFKLKYFQNILQITQDLFVFEKITRELTRKHTLSIAFCNIIIFSTNFIFVSLLFIFKQDFIKIYSKTQSTSLLAIISILWIKVKFYKMYSKTPKISPYNFFLKNMPLGPYSNGMALISLFLGKKNI